MRLYGLVLLTWACAWAAEGATLPPPIAEASHGKLECHSPDAARKACRSLDVYTRRADGGIDDASTTLLTSKPAIVLSAVSPVTIKGNQVCGAITQEELSAATFTVDGVLATADQTDTLRGRLQATLQPAFGHEVCTAHVIDGDKIVAKVTVDGAAKPGGDETIIWVSPAERYTVKP